jgi:hypothetical protein
LNTIERRPLVNGHSRNRDDFDADADDLGPMGEIEYEESDGAETAVEVELLLARMQTTRFPDV